MKKPLALGVFCLGLIIAFSHDAIAQWASGGPYGGRVHAVAARGGTVFAGTWGGGISLSIDNGKSWKGVNEGMGNGNVRSLAISGGTLFAGTGGGGVWQRPVSEMVRPTKVCKPRETDVPGQFEIIVPGRSGSIATVAFTLFHEDQASIALFDPVGREVSTLVNRHFKAGSYRYSWDTHAVARGCYLARFQAGPRTCVKLVQVAH